MGPASINRPLLAELDAPPLNWNGQSRLAGSRWERYSTGMRAYEEIVEWIAGGPSVSQVACFQASPAVKERVARLIRKEKTVGLIPEEKSDLDHYEQLEHIMRLAKARAHHRLTHEQLGS
jgi:hypothetical protein